MPYIETERLKMFYRVSGNGPKQVLLVHGNLVNSRFWERTTPLLPKELYTVYAPDMKGAGQTPETKTPHTIPEFARELTSFVKALNLKNFHLVGHSVGGAISLEYLLNNPGYASTLTLLDSVPANGLNIPEEALPLFEQMRTNKKVHFETLMATVPSMSPEDPLIIDVLTDAFETASAETYLENAKNCSAWNTEEKLSNITIPSLVLWGERDNWIPRGDLERTAKLLPNSKWQVLEGVGHGPNMECPDRLAEVMRGFWENGK